MQIFISNVILLGKRVLLLLLFYTICRIYFFCFNFPTLIPIDFGQLCSTFIWGIRFDFSAIFFFNLIFYLLHFLPFQFVENSKYQRVTTQMMIFINMFALLLNVIDTGYFSYQNSRSSADFLSNLFSSDTTNLLPQYICDYWYHLLFFILLYVAAEYFFPKYSRYEYLFGKWTNLKCSLIAILIFAVSFMIYRGFDTKPLRVVDTVKYADTKYSAFMLNTPFSVFRSIGKSDIVEYKYFEDDELLKIYSPVHQYSDSKFTRKNVIVFVLESFSRRSIGALTGTKGYTPFLDSLLNHSYTFTHAFANGTRSVQSIPSILSSIPQLMESTIIGSKYAVAQTDALPILLKREGYQTAFFHGAFNGSMGFDKYCKGIGIDNYFGMNEFLEGKSVDENNYDSDWGIFDDKFLLFAKSQFDKFSEPFFASIFTISSHHPFVVPQEFAHLFHEAEAPLNAMRYADFSLQKFFEAAKQTDWFQNTIFVFVADHTTPFSLENYPGQEFVSPIVPADYYRIPIAFYVPADTAFHKFDNRVMQQIDIAPTLLSLMNYPKEFISFGQSMFADSANHQAIFFKNGLYHYVDSSAFITFDGSKVVSCSDVNFGEKVPIEPTELQLNNLKAFIQTYSQRMKTGRLSAYDAE